MTEEEIRAENALIKQLANEGFTDQEILQFLAAEKKKAPQEKKPPMSMAEFAGPWSAEQIEKAGRSADLLGRVLDYPSGYVRGATFGLTGLGKEGDVERVVKGKAPLTEEALQRAGWENTTAVSDVLPGLYSETGEGLPLQKGGILDPTVRGAVGFLGDIGFDVATGVGAKKLAQGVSKGAGALAKKLGSSVSKIPGEAIERVYKNPQMASAPIEQVDNLTQRLTQVPTEQVDVFKDKLSSTISTPADRIELTEKAHEAIMKRRADLNAQAAELLDKASDSGDLVDISAIKDKIKKAIDNDKLNAFTEGQKRAALAREKELTETLLGSKKIDPFTKEVSLGEIPDRVSPGEALRLADDLKNRSNIAKYSGPSVSGRMGLATKEEKQWANIFEDARRKTWDQLSDATKGMSNDAKSIFKKAYSNNEIYSKKLNTPEKLSSVMESGLFTPQGNVKSGKAKLVEVLKQDHPDILDTAQKLHQDRLLSEKFTEAGTERGLKLLKNNPNLAKTVEERVPGANQLSQKLRDVDFYARELGTEDKALRNLSKLEENPKLREKLFADAPEAIGIKEHLDTAKYFDKDLQKALKHGAPPAGPAAKLAEAAAYAKGGYGTALAARGALSLGRRPEITQAGISGARTINELLRKAGRTTRPILEQGPVMTPLRRSLVEYGSDRRQR